MNPISEICLEKCNFFQILFFRCTILLIPKLITSQQPNPHLSHINSVSSYCFLT
jgi:hypothetical protein